MNQITLRGSVRLAIVIAALGLGFAATVHADCVTAANPFGPAPRLRVTSVPESTVVRAAEPESSASTSRLADSNASGLSIVGLWHSFAMSGGQVVDEAFEQWNSDGTEVLNDNPPPSSGNICLGVFVKSAPSTYKLKHPSWTYDASGNLSGTAIIRELVFLSADGMSYQGTFTVNVYDLDGKQLAQYGGTVSATRITVDF